MSPARRASFAEFLRRLCAAGGIALVLGLTVFAASPALHDLLHSATDTTHDDTCPVVLFAQAAIPPAEPVSVPLPPVVTNAVVPLSPEELFVASPRYLRQPERGPPARV
jgi:hypothetical protein